MALVDEPKEFWFNLKTGEVEVGKQVAALYRVGPFATFAEASKALEKLAERSASWKADEEREN